MGLPFVGMLVQEQLQGTLQVKREKGTECVIRFRLAEMTDQ
jgi:two-component sensor histidine kinase